MSESREAQEMMRTRVGYRTEAAYGEGFRDATAVITHEVLELGNTDEQEQIATALGLPPASSLPEIFYAITKRFGTGAKALWLAQLKTVVAYYGGELGENIDAYTIPRGALLVIDNGYDGQLFLMTDVDYREMLRTVRGK